MSPEAEEVNVLDVIYPTHVGIMQPASLKAEPTRSSEYVPPVCFGYLPEAGQPDLSSVMAGVLEGSLREAFLHNGASLIWIEGLGEFLGVGHIVRGNGGTPKQLTARETLVTNHHYTNSFFTISGSAPYHMRRLGTEFCLESSQFGGDCETLQFVSSLALEGDKLHVGYGIMDCEAAVMTMNLSQALSTLQLLPQVDQTAPHA